MINVGVGGENYFRRPCNVSSSPSPIVAACFNASKISHSMFFFSLELSLLYWNIGGGLDAVFQCKLLQLV
jgi:hypothetical protein